MKRIKRKNPTEKAKQLAEQIIGQKVKFLAEGRNGEVYKFENKIIKIFNTSIEDKKQLKYLLQLSNKKLLPKIYEITNKYYIQDYVKGITLTEYLKDRISYQEALDLIDSIKKVIHRWHNEGFAHGNLDKLDNILITENKVIFIDPIGYLFSWDYGYLDEKDLEYIEKEIMEMAE